jgi:hypothetical protein
MRWGANRTVETAGSVSVKWFPGQDSNLDFQSQILAACQLADPGNGAEGWI